MGDVQFSEPTAEQKLEWEFNTFKREHLIARTRAAVVRKQLVEAYEILDRIRFDFVSDTAFRDKVVRAKQSIESAIDDYLMSDSYHEESIDKAQKMTIEDYKEIVNQSPASSK